jgi:molybdate transport system ATP-binding protein
MNLDLQLAVQRGSFRLDVQLDVAARGIIALSGPSGCGKTTVLRCLAGLDRHPGAVVRLGDITWQSGSRFVPPHRRHIGYVFQESALLPHLSVRDNLHYGWSRTEPSRRSIAVDDAIAWLGIEALLERRPHTLSGGERQRVAIARALATSPRLLLLDEPLASLDPERKREILPYLDALRSHLATPIVYVSHSTEEVARLADHLVLIRDGRLVAHGGIATLLTRLDLPLAHGTDAASLIDATVVGQDADNHLTRLQSAAGSLLVVHRELAPQSRVRLRIAARDVSLTLSEPKDTSILNRFPATITEMAPTGSALTTVRLRVGECVLLSRITNRSAAQLALQPGSPVYAQVKSVALLD